MTHHWHALARIVAVLVLTLVVASTLSTTRAADFEPAQPSSPMHDWSGFYGGVHAGYVWGDFDYSGGAFGASTNVTPEDGLFGLLVGYNYQMETFVIGIEGDSAISYANDRRTVGAAVPVPVRGDIDALFSLRARLGFAMDNVLVFGTAGAGLLETKTRAPGFVSEDTHWGFVIGGGVEWALNDTWSVRSEYLYGDFERENVGGGISLDPDIHVVRAALIWKFGGLLAGF